MRSPGLAGPWKRVRLYPDRDELLQEPDDLPGGDLVAHELGAVLRQRAVRHLSVDEVLAHGVAAVLVRLPDLFVVGSQDPGTPVVENFFF